MAYSIGLPLSSESWTQRAALIWCALPVEGCWLLTELRRRAEEEPGGTNHAAPAALGPARCQTSHARLDCGDVVEWYTHAHAHTHRHKHIFSVLRISVSAIIYYVSMTLHHPKKTITGSEGRICLKRLFVCLFIYFFISCDFPSNLKSFYFFFKVRICWFSSLLCN